MPMAILRHHAKDSKLLQPGIVRITCHSIHTCEVTEDTLQNRSCAQYIEYVTTYEEDYL